MCVGLVISLLFARGFFLYLLHVQILAPFPFFFLFTWKASRMKMNHVDQDCISINKINSTIYLHTYTRAIHWIFKLKLFFVIWENKNNFFWIKYLQTLNSTSRIHIFETFLDVLSRYTELSIYSIFSIIWYVWTNSNILKICCCYHIFYVK